MSKKSEKNINFFETSLNDHNQHKKELIPPLAKLNVKNSSWLDERLPEMLWAVLIIGNMKRNEALDFFRYVAKFVEKNTDCSNITISGISKLEDQKSKSLINHMCKFSKTVKDIFRVFLLFPDLPAIENWKEHLENQSSIDDFETVFHGVGKTYEHQSQEATDCRWIKVVCEILGGKVILDNKKKQNIFKYPNHHDMNHLSSFIRAVELGLANKETSAWSKYFWKICHEKTECIPEEIVNEKIQSRREKLSEEIKDTKKHYFDDTVKLRNNLITHFFKTSETSTINSRHEGAFGLTIYALSLYIETIFYGKSCSITGRLVLRTLFETFITFTYMLKKEKDTPEIWDVYRTYGTGQIKKTYLKLKEIQDLPKCINLNELYRIGNEDKWMEFTPIHLGHWDSSNLRKISNEIGLKELYDKLYDYSSGFTHGNWGAIRESVYQKCSNPLHRYHNIPIYDLPLMPSITNDAREIINSIFDCLCNAYPDFKYRLTRGNIQAIY